MRAAALFLVAGLLEIGGGYLVWRALRGADGQRGQRSVLFALLGFAALSLYGIIPVYQSPEHPFGRVYAAYGAVFIVLSVAWGAFVDGQAPDRRDLAGVAVCLVGAAIMMWPRR